MTLHVYLLVLSIHHLLLFLLPFYLVLWWGAPIQAARCSVPPRTIACLTYRKSNNSDSFTPEVSLGSPLLFPKCMSLKAGANPGRHGEDLKNPHRIGPLPLGQFKPGEKNVLFLCLTHTFILSLSKCNLTFFFYCECKKCNLFTFLIYLISSLAAVKLFDLNIKCCII